jgi:hypothetical protein
MNPEARFCKEVTVWTDAVELARQAIIEAFESEETTLGERLIVARALVVALEAQLAAIGGAFAAHNRRTGAGQVIVIPAPAADGA